MVAAPVDLVPTTTGERPGRTEYPRAIARVELDKNWSTEKSPEAVAELVDAIAAECKLQPARADEGDTTALKGGSQTKLRLLGGWFQGADVLPIKGLVTHEAGHVHLHLEETMGIGILDSILRRKYEDEFALISTRLADGLGA